MDEFINNFNSFSTSDKNAMIALLILFLFNFLVFYLILEKFYRSFFSFILGVKIERITPMQSALAGSHGGILWRISNNNILLIYAIFFLYIFSLLSYVIPSTILGLYIFQDLIQNVI